MAGVIASVHTIIYTYARNIYSLRGAGCVPDRHSITRGAHKTPHVAPVDSAVLLNMAVFDAIVAYLLQMISSVMLRQRQTCFRLRLRRTSRR